MPIALTHASSGALAATAAADALETSKHTVEGDMCLR
jgi:hypothetical protein